MALLSADSLQKLAAVRAAVREFVLDYWVSGSPKFVHDKFVNFLEAEKVDAARQGFAVRSVSPYRPWQQVPDYTLTEIKFINELPKEQRDARAQVFSDVSNLVNYFAGWDYDESRQRLRPVVSWGDVGVAGGVRARVLREKSAEDKEKVEQAQVEVNSELANLARVLGIDVSGDWSQSAAEIARKFNMATLVGAVVVGGAVVYFVGFRK